MSLKRMGNCGSDELALLDCSKLSSLFEQVAGRNIEEFCAAPGCLAHCGPPRRG